MRCHIGCITLPCLAVLLSLGGCIFDSTNAKEGASASTTTTAVNPPTQNAFVRTCKTSVHGTIDSADWRNHSIVAGPLVFYYADQFADQPESLFAPIPGKDGYHAGQKLLILVQRGAVATVVVPYSERPHAALIYDPAAWNDVNAYRIGASVSTAASPDTLIQATRGVRSSSSPPFCYVTFGMSPREGVRCSGQEQG